MSSFVYGGLELTLFTGGKPGRAGSRGAFTPGGGGEAEALATAPYTDLDPIYASSIADTTRFLQAAFVTDADTITRPALPTPHRSSKSPRCSATPTRSMPGHRPGAGRPRQADLAAGAGHCR